MDRIAEITGLRSSLSHLSASLRKLCDDLARGIPRLSSDHDELKLLVQRFKILRAQQTDEARQLGIHLDGRCDDLDALLRREDSLAAFRRTLQRFQTAFELLADAQRLRHIDEPDYAPLARLHEQARVLEARLDSDVNPKKDKELAGLVAGKHPFHDLLLLVRRGQDLAVEDPEQYFRCVHAVKTSLGPKLAAIAPWRLVLGEPSASEEETVQSAPAPLAEPPAVDAPASQTQEPVAAPPAEAVEAEPPAPDLAHGATPHEEAALATSRHDTTASATLTEIPKPAPAAADPKPGRAPAVPPPENAELSKALRQELWQLVAEGRLGLAAEVARCLSGMHVEEALPPEVFEISVLAASVHEPIGPRVDELVRSNDRLIELFLTCDRSDEGERCAVLLLVAPLVRAALISRASRSVQCLEIFHCDSQVSAFHDLIHEVQSFRKLGIELDAPTLRALGTNVSWAASLEQFAREVGFWLQKARNKKVIYHHSTMVWCQWLDVDQELGRSLEALARGGRLPPKQLRALASTWSDEAALNTRIAKTDEANRGAKARLNPIKARARTSLKQNAREAASFLQRAAELFDNEPTETSGFVTEKLGELRRSLQVHIAAMRRQSHTLTEAESFAVAAAAQVALRSLDPLATVLDATQPEATEQPTHLLLRHELLRFPGLKLGAEWRPQQMTPVQFGHKLLSLRAEGPNCDWQRVFEQHCKQRNMLAARRVVEALGALRGETDEVVRLRDCFESQLCEWRESLQRRKQEVETEIERAVAHFYLEGAERTRHLGLVQDLQPEQVLEFHDAFRLLTNVQSLLDLRRRAKQEEIGGLIEAKRAAGIDEAALARASAALENGNLLAAHELLARLDSGEGVLEDVDPLATFKAFFPQFCKSVSERPRALSQLLRDVEERKTSHGLSFGRLPSSQLESAIRMLKSWMTLRRVQPHDGSRRGSQAPARCLQELRHVLEGMGFEVQSLVEVDETARQARSFDVQCRPIRDRDYCPLPEFGSMAEGQYRIVAVWGRPTIEELLEWGRGSHPAARFIFYFGRMSEATRRELAEQARRSRKPMALVIDDIVLFFLCGQRRLRLHALFRCTLPFSQGFPYTTTAGLVHPEMFFGRERERDEIMKAGGTCLVYGGRQLGKTALLRKVERDNHKPRLGIIVRYIDLKGTVGLGTVRPIGDIWQLILDVLREEGVIRVRTPLSPKDIQEKVVAWLQDDRRRRIVILLDEADDFLGADGRDTEKRRFFHLHQIKETMEGSQWRFKVVFSGLHNVQRTSRTINTPLAHLGTPVCIGPLLDRGEVIEARRLILLPFAALGYEFAREDLVTTILARTNYYPSLIQLFCKHLLELLARARFDRRRTPPRMITDAHIDEAYRSPALRQAILDRFQWTLDLDARYGFIALLIAFESLQEAEEAEDRDLAERRQGYSVARVRERSLELWPKGFADDSSLAAFATILDEMVGLGLFRRLEESGRYGFRSPNVLKLFGRPKDIEARLLEAREREPHPIYEPHAFRRSVETRWVRSPLTALQESQLLRQENGVCLLFGCKASGLDFVRKSLAQPAEDQSVRVREFPRGKGASVKAFRSWLQKAVSRPHEDQLLYIGPDIDWNAKWVDIALQLQHGEAGSTHIVRTLFLGGPDKAWQWVLRRAMDRRNLEPLVSILSLAPWHDAMLRRWLLDNELGTADNRETRERIYEVTGRWDHFMDELGRLCRDSTGEWRTALETIQKRLHGEGEYVRGFPDVPEARSILRILAQLREPALPEELFDLAEDAAKDRIQIQRTLEWGELLSWVEREQDGRWRLRRSLTRVFDSAAG